MHLTYDPAISLLCMYQQDIKTSVHKLKKNTYTRMFMSVSSGITKNWKTDLSVLAGDINRRLDNRFAVCSYNAKLFYNRKEQATDPQNNLDGSQRLYPE